MRIGIDARKLHDFGIGTYLQNLLKELVRLDDDAEYVVLCRADDVAWLTELGPRLRPVVTRADKRRHARARSSYTGAATVFHYSVIFLVIALIAAALGFGGIAGSAVGIAKILFLIFLVLFVVSLVFGRRGQV